MPRTYVTFRILRRHELVPIAEEKRELAAQRVARRHARVRPSDGPVLVERFDPYGEPQTVVVFRAAYSSAAGRVLGSEVWEVSR